MLTKQFFSECEKHFSNIKKKKFPTQIEPSVEWKGSVDVKDS